MNADAREPRPPIIKVTITKKKGEHGWEVVRRDMVTKAKVGGVAIVNPSLIRSYLLGVYNILHRFRWPTLLVCCGSIVVSGIFASKLEMSQSSDVRLLDSSYEFEKNYEWRKRLLHKTPEQASKRAYIMFGVKPADTGDFNDPNNFSQLLLDATFDPSTEQAQSYLLGLCDRVYEQEWANPPSSGYTCSINRFDAWLKAQAASSDPDSIYTDHCGGASGIPISSEFFHRCMYSWGQQVEEMNVLARNGIIEIMYFPIVSRVRSDSPYNDLHAEWHLVENWMAKERQDNAPEGANNAFLSSEDFWWYDTNTQMISSVYSAATTTLMGAAVALLCATRSFSLTLLGTLTIVYVLTTVTAICAAMGWTLGFLEAICFVILFGASCDFVIHFSYSYASQKGDVDRGGRTQHALLEMGPSILVGALTAMAGAALMMVTANAFFHKFATILFLTVIQATFGSFALFLSMTDCLGPSRPSAFTDKVFSKCSECLMAVMIHRRVTESPRNLGTDPS
jgi:protein dispatched 1